jgi:regulator of sirC expression with transglutaminase-like and TPR domain
MMLDSSKIKALISLLDDPQKEVWESAMIELSRAEFNQIDLLNEFRFDEEVNSEQLERLEMCITKIRYQHFGNKLIEWKTKKPSDLLEAITYICQLAYPEVTYEKLLEKLESLRLDAWLEFHYDLTSFEKVKILNYILFQLHGFRGDEETFMAPENCFINKVLDNKKGNPISLSIIYMLVAQKLNVPIYGVNLPRHFIMAYVEDEETDTIESFNSKQEISSEAQGEIKFYINAYNGGGVFNLDQLKNILKEMEFEEKPEFMNPCNNQDIVLRVLMNLFNSYRLTENAEALYLDEVINLYKSI